jgi:hypothetical protein
MTRTDTPTARSPDPPACAASRIALGARAGAKLGAQRRPRRLPVHGPAAVAPERQRPRFVLRATTTAALVPQAERSARRRPAGGCAGTTAMDRSRKTRPLMCRGDRQLSRTCRGNPRPTESGSCSFSELAPAPRQKQGAGPARIHGNRPAHRVALASLALARMRAPESRSAARLLRTSSERGVRPGADDRNPRPMQARGGWRAGRLELVRCITAAPVRPASAPTETGTLPAGAFFPTVAEAPSMPPRSAAPGGERLVLRSSVARGRCRTRVRRR